MIDLSCDYNNGAHPAVLRRLIETNGELTSTYGLDVYSASAAEKIKKACGINGGDVFFLGGGTQTNMTVISSCLMPYQGVISASTGHINCHEAGAVEYCGVKVITLPQHRGKIDPGELDAYMRTFYGDESRDHMVFPGMVYISFPTEYGTLYPKAELESLRRVCDEFGLMLFADGARLGYALACDECDVTLNDLARLCDVFYIGGTKVGALCGEAVVFPKKAPAHFITMVKQHGAMFAKGRLIGVQFDALFTDGLYLKIARNAIDRARELRRIIADRGYEFFIDSPTNQQFVKLGNEDAERIMKAVKCEIWEKPDPGHTVLRFVTSWATTEDDIKAFGDVV